MTPTEEAAKLARDEDSLHDAVCEIVDACIPGSTRDPYGNLRCDARITTRQILDKYLAERDEELKRLREAAEKLLALMDEIPDYPDGCQKDRVFAEFEFDELRAALQPKEPNNETR